MKKLLYNCPNCNSITNIKKSKIYKDDAGFYTKCQNCDKIWYFSNEMSQKLNS